MTSSIESMTHPEQTCYVGWVPTVTGRLSFSHFGACESHHTRDVNRADEGRRFLLVYQTRDPSDVLLPFRKHLSEPLLGIKGDLQFVCIATTADIDDDSQALLNGHLFIIDYKGAWRKSVRETIRKARDKLRDYKFSVVSPSIEKYFSPTFAESVEVCSANCLFQGEFSLKRNGVVNVSINHQMTTAQNAPSLPDNPAQARHVRHILAAQLFYFLRDIGHRHRHHSTGTDTIVDLHETDGNDDLIWRRKTLYNIYRRIISNKRTDNLAAHFKSLGLLAYAKAFKHICEEELQDGKKLPVFYDDALEESVRASELKMEAEAQDREKKIGNARNYILSLFGILFTTIGLLGLVSAEHTESFVPSEFLIYVAKFVIEEPLPIFVIGIAAFYVLGKWDLRIDAGKLIEALQIIQSVLQPTHKFLMVSFFVGFGVFLAALPILFLLLF